MSTFIIGFYYTAGQAVSDFETIAKSLQLKLPDFRFEKPFLHRLEWFEIIPKEGYGMAKRSKKKMVGDITKPGADVPEVDERNAEAEENEPTTEELAEAAAADLKAGTPLTEVFPDGILAPGGGTGADLSGPAVPLVEHREPSEDELFERLIKIPGMTVVIAKAIAKRQPKNSRELEIILGEVEPVEASREKCLKGLRDRFAIFQ